MAMDRKYRYALEKAGLTETEVDLRFQNIDRRMKNLHIGDRLYEIDNEQHVNWVYMFRLVNIPYYEWTVTSIIDKEYGIIGVTNEKYGTSDKRGIKKKSILNLNRFEEGFEMCPCMFQESKGEHYKNVADKFVFFDHYPDYWNTDNQPVTFYCSDMYGKDYLIEHSIPDFKVSVLIDAKKQEINFSIDVSPDFKEQAIEMIAIDAQYKKVALMGEGPEQHAFMTNYRNGLRTAMALRSQNIGDLITICMVSANIYSSGMDGWKNNYLFPSCDFEIPRKCYYWSLPLSQFFANKPNKCFNGPDGTSCFDGICDLKRTAGVIVAGNEDIFWDAYDYHYKYIWHELSPAIAEACEKRNFKNSSVYKFASQIIEKGAP